MKKSGICTNISSNIYNNNNNLNSIEYKKINFFHTKNKLSFNKTDNNINYSNDIRYKSPLLKNKNISNNLTKKYFSDVGKSTILEFRNLMDYKENNLSELSFSNIKDNHKKNIQNNINIISVKNNYLKNKI